ncbi:MAG TPA: barstar family protein [Chitinophagaceae bacterium]|jgi:RNAse (barnase) inhibitor barstar|nr:barstar family protein [Chitinophagaceae bacterium]
MSHLYTLTENKFVSEASDTYFALIDGDIISSMKEFYTAISKALNFPDYFGENLDALDEMLYDLDWIENLHVLLIVRNSNLMLKDQPKEKEEIINLIKEIDNPFFEVCFM